MDKHHIFLGLAMAVTLLMVACGGAAVAPTATRSPTPTSPPSPTAAATAAPTATTAPAQLSGAELGKSLSARNGCTACHSVDGGPGIGPTWQGLFGKEETLSDGSTVQVDEAYLRESIADPNATIVKGFVAGIMPQDFGTRLTEEQIQAIIEYIKTLQ